MATAKKATKPPAKKVVAPPKTKKSEPLYDMPRKVSDWIDQAMSTINHQKGEIERLKLEVKELKAYKRWAEHRILRSDHE